MSYNGWANYETWNVALWLGNDEGTYRSAIAAARQVGVALTPEQAGNIVRELMPNGTPDFNGKVDRYKVVDWRAIADDINEMAGLEVAS